ncbi:MAG: hypothetical protein AB7G37_09140, partial [Solirubrobacteraceae bacterium]
ATGIVGKPTKRVTVDVTETTDGNLATPPADLRKAAQEFLHPKAPPGGGAPSAASGTDGGAAGAASTGGGPSTDGATSTTDDATSGPGDASLPRQEATLKRRRARNPGSLIDATAGTKAVIEAKIGPGLQGLPIYHPTLMPRSGRIDETSTRQYDIQSPGGRAYPWRAYRLVVQTDGLGQYYGVQGTDWTDPPIVRAPADRERIGGRTFLVQYDGSKIRRMIYRGEQGTYWVTNTLSNRLTNAEMRAIARSLKRTPR